ncbi:hypothetical protein IWX64_003036 [Arthrobacter sp. CAN_A212]|uniref:hypothetical protein n=1 Tax=Arthrobacter sp. CAN_A212 TaxID=2787719 RepID=UPI0018C8EF36
MTYADHADHQEPRATRPVATWVLMLLAFAVVFFLPDWAGSGTPRPIWVFTIPILLGLTGAAFALRTRHPWWAATSALWGFVLIQVLVVTITLISGP